VVTASAAGRVGFAAGFALATGGVAVLAAAFFAAGWPTRDGARLAAARFAGAGRVVVFFGALFGAFLGAFLVVFARLLDACFFLDAGLDAGRDARRDDRLDAGRDDRLDAGRDDRLDDGLAGRRAAARGELRFGRLALLPVGRFLAMAV
jgi:hypothetical protein